jgi:valyl-tRNA synthetase
MLGDVAIAIHSSHERADALKGLHVWHPFRKCPLPIIVDDEAVDPELGTGCVKLTPSHDFDDFATAKRHSLPSIPLFDSKGKMNQLGSLLNAEVN